MRCITITLYRGQDNHPNYQIFRVQHLTDRMFSCGFRVVNPEFNATPDLIKSDTERVMEICQARDASEEFVARPKFERSSARERFLRKFQAHDWRSL